jgi:hypothetical protein
MKEAGDTGLVFRKLSRLRNFVLMLFTQTAIQTTGGQTSGMASQYSTKASW